MTDTLDTVALVVIVACVAALLVAAVAPSVLARWMHGRRRPTPTDVPLEAVDRLGRAARPPRMARGAYCGARHAHPHHAYQMPDHEWFYCEGA